MARLTRLPEARDLSTKQIERFLYGSFSPMRAIRSCGSPPDRRQLREDCRTEATSAQAGTRSATSASSTPRKPSRKGSSPCTSPNTEATGRPPRSRRTEADTSGIGGSVAYTSVDRSACSCDTKEAAPQSIRALPILPNQNGHDLNPIWV